MNLGRYVKAGGMPRLQRHDHQPLREKELGGSIPQPRQT